MIASLIKASYFYNCKRQSESFYYVLKEGTSTSNYQLPWPKHRIKKDCSSGKAIIGFNNLCDAFPNTRYLSHPFLKNLVLVSFENSRNPSALLITPELFTNSTTSCCPVRTNTFKKTDLLEYYFFLYDMG